jgi:putative iron-dependent peroxidase
MFICAPPGNDDRILDFSTAVTGPQFFVPTLDFLEDPPPLREDDVGAAETAPPSAQGPVAGPDSGQGAGSLGIGGLGGRGDSVPT